MKCQIIEADINHIKLLCPANKTGYGAKFTVGQFVNIEDATTGSSEQNRLFHKLITLWQTSGCCPYAGCVDEVKKQIKRDYGEGFESYAYINDNYTWGISENYHDIPADVRRHPERITGKLKSWSDYTKKQRQGCISNVISMMIETGVNGKEFDEICKELV